MQKIEGTLTNTTYALAADPGRDAMIISNPSDTAMTYEPGGTASATVGIAIAAGLAINVPLPFIRCAGTLFCAGTSKAFAIYVG